MAGKERHVLGLSGGRDSAALAAYMRQNHPQLEIDYFFHRHRQGTCRKFTSSWLSWKDSLGKPILRLNPDRDFDFWLKQYNNFLPSPQARWCTRQLKLRPFEQWIRPIARRWRNRLQLRRDPCRRRVPRRLRFQTRQFNGTAAAEGSGYRQSRGLGDTRRHRTGAAPVLRMAHTQRMHFLFLPTENRMGAPDGASSRLFRGGQELREECHRPRIAIHME